jgi:hypothetical protein
MKYFKYVSAVLMIWLLFVLTAGCGKLPEPIDRILLMKAPHGQEVPPAAYLSFTEKDPMPIIVYEFSSADKLYVGIRISKELTENITFTKYTIFNKDTSAEWEIGLSGELGPYEPGQIPLLNLYDKWVLPTEKGHYEFRVYWDNRIVSKALFNIVE